MVRADGRTRTAGRRRAVRLWPVALAIALGMATSIAVAAKPHAHAARTLHAHEKAKLHYVGAVGELVYEKGRATGTLPGGMRVHMIFASTFRGRFTIHTRGGSINGHGAARPHGGGVWESFAGRLVVTGGTGRYHHAHGTARLYGTFNRNNYALSIKTAGTLRF